MSCERYAKTLAALAAGARAPAELDEHLAACAACRAQLLALRDALALADATLGAVLAEEPRPELAVRIRQAAAAERGRQTSGLSWRWTWAVASAGAFVAVLWLATSVLREAPSSSASATRPAAMPVPSRAAELRENARLREDARMSSPPATAAHDGRHAATSEGRASGPARARRTVRSSTTEPLVLVPAGEREALLRFADQLQERTVSPDSLLVADPSRELPPLEPLRIEPLEIAPLTEAGKS